MLRPYTISPNGIALIKQFEAFRAKPYLDPIGIATQGYGSTRHPDGTKVKLTDPAITEAKATEYLKHDLKVFEAALNKLVTASLNQNQTDSLLSLIYNIGPAAFSKSTALKLINKNPSDPAIAEAIQRYKYAGGKILNGLLLRRQKESALYFS